MSTQEELNLQDYLSVIKKKRWLIIGGLVIGLVVGGVATLILPRVYQSQLIMEVGRIYLPPAKEKPKQEIEFLEEPDATAEILKSDALIFQVRRKLNLDVPLTKMRKDLEVITFREDVSPAKMGSPLVEVIYRGSSPENVVNVLTDLAQFVIETHQKRYLDNISALESRVVNQEEKISGIQKVIDRQVALREEIKEQVKLLTEKVSGFDKNMDPQQSSKMTQVEVLFFNSYTSNQERIVSTLNDALAEIDTSISENQEKIGDFKDDIANIRNLANLCQRTRIRSQAILPAKPIKPDLWLNLILGALAGLVLTVIIAFCADRSSRDK